MTHPARALALACGLSLGAATSPAVTEPLLRFPDVHGDTLVFVHGDDLWTAPAGGGLARRLTDHEGVERQPRFSPDGRLIAFTAEIDGNPDVYVMNADGSDLRRAHLPRRRRRGDRLAPDAGRRCCSAPAARASPASTACS